MIVKTIAAGATEKFQLNYVPEKLIITSTDASEDLLNKVAVKVTPLGDGVICDLDEYGVSILDSINKKGGVSTAAATVNTLEVQLSDGLVPDKVTDYEIENKTTKSIEVYAPVTKRATLYIKSMQQTLLANSQSVFSKFSILGFNDDGQTKVTVDFEDGTSHTYSSRELSRNNTKLTIWLAEVVYNLDATVRKVTTIPNVQSTAYLMRYVNL